MKKHTIGTLNAALAAVSYGTNPLFAIPMFNLGIGVNSVLFYRYFLATIIYFVWLKFAKKTCLKVTKEQVFCLFLVSVVFSLSSLLLFDAFNYMPSGLACTILFIYPIFVALIACLFRQEKITSKVIMAMFFTTFGIFSLYNGDINLSTKGIVLVLLSGLCYAVYMVAIKSIKPLRRLKSEVLSFYVMLLGLSVYIVNLKFCTQLQPLNSPLCVCCALGLAILPTIISLETIAIGIKLIGATKTAVIGALEPLTALFFGILLFKEVLTLKIVFGIILIFVGVNLVIFNKKA